MIQNCLCGIVCISEICMHSCADIYVCSVLSLLILGSRVDRIRYNNLPPLSVHCQPHPEYNVAQPARFRSAPWAITRCGTCMYPVWSRCVCKNQVWIDIHFRRSLACVIAAVAVIITDQSKPVWANYYQHHTFSIAGPVVWNGLPAALCPMPRALKTTFYSNLKTVLFSQGWTLLSR